MQQKVDTHGFKILGLRGAVSLIKFYVRARECYFVYYDLKDNKVTVNEPAGYSATKILVIESGVYELTQQELADAVVDKIRLSLYN